MGQAARRKGKTLDDRIKFAISRKEAEQKRLQELAEQRACEELQAIKTMVWWQIDLTIERMEYLEKRRMKSAMLSSVLAGTIYSTLGGMYGFGRR